jgi:hypothetical protein
VNRALGSRPCGFDPRADHVSLAGGTRTKGRLHWHCGIAITAHRAGAFLNRSRDCTRSRVPPLKRRRCADPPAGAFLCFEKLETLARARHPDASPRIPKGRPRAKPAASGASLHLLPPSKGLDMGSFHEPRFQGGKGTGDGDVRDKACSGFPC